MTVLKQLKILVANYPAAKRVLNYYQPPFITNPVFDRDIVECLIDVIKVFETQRTQLLSEQFRRFANTVLD